MPVYVRDGSARISFTCCHTKMKVADSTFHLTPSQYTQPVPALTLYLDINRSGFHSVNCWKSVTDLLTYWYHAAHRAQSKHTHLVPYSTPYTITTHTPGTIQHTVHNHNTHTWYHTAHRTQSQHTHLVPYSTPYTITTHTPGTIQHTVHNHKTHTWYHTAHRTQSQNTHLVPYSTPYTITKHTSGTIQHTVHNHNTHTWYHTAHCTQSKHTHLFLYLS